jgi:hypothetical protein
MRRAFVIASSLKKIPDAPIDLIAYDQGGNRSYNSGLSIIAFSKPALDTALPITGYTVSTSSGSPSVAVSLSVSRVNHILNPSFEGGMQTWGSTGNPGTYSSAQARVGAGSALLAYNGSATVGLASSTITCVPGQPLTASFYVKRSADIGAIAFNFIFNGADGNPVSDFTHASVGPEINTQSWYRGSQTVVTPDNAFSFFLRIYITAGENAGSTPFNAFIDAVIIEKSPLLSDYFDGTNTILTAGRYTSVSNSWSGTANSSTSSFSATDSTGPYFTEISGLTAGTNYLFNATSTNVIGTSSASLNSNQITSTTVPQQPTIGTVSRVSNTQASIPFTAGATGAKSILGYRIVSSPAITLTYNTVQTTSPITVSGSFALNTSYNFYIEAYNGNGYGSASAFSNGIVVNTVAPVAPTVTPTAPTVTPTAPTVTPTAPTVTPTAPTVTPTAPTAPTVTPTAPTAPTVTPTAPTVTPTAPTVTPTAPTAPTVTPTAPSSCTPGSVCEYAVFIGYCAGCSPYPCYRNYCFNSSCNCSTPCGLILC